MQHRANLTLIVAAFLAVGLVASRPAAGQG